MIAAAPISLGGIVPSLKPWIAQRNPTKVIVISDVNTHRLCLPLIREALPANTVYFTLKPEPNQHLEEAKSLNSAERIWTSMHEFGIDRQSLVLNLGGGVVTDLGGFCAAIYKRGIPYASVPTSLLAMTDASLGGKTGVNFQGIKNMLGIVLQPEHVFIDPIFLKTLPPRELVSGYAEVVKHALIGHPALRDAIAAAVPLQAAPEDLLEVLTLSIQTKIDIVQADPFEKGLRKLLNFGHTIGHALESWFLNTQDPLTHGEAVAIGLIAESYIQKSPHLEWLIKVLGESFIHRSIPEESFDALWTIAQQDKKNIGNTVQIAVPGMYALELQLLEVARCTFDEALSFYNNLAKNR